MPATSRSSLAPVPDDLPRDTEPVATRELVEALASCQDPRRDAELRDELVRLHLGLAASIAARYRDRGVEREDLRQVAHLALTKAARRFDPGSGHLFVSFCVPTIRGEVRRHFRDHGWVVRPPRRVQDLQPRLARAAETLTKRLGREPSDHELADLVEVPLAEVQEAQGSLGCFAPSSLDSPVGVGDDTASLGDLLADGPGGPGGGDEQAQVEARAVLAPHVRRLSDRDRHILRLRFFSGLTQREIAQDIGVTQMQVSRLLTRILRQLRAGIGSLDA